MNIVNRITCPSCRTALKSVRGIRIGRKIKCLHCQIAFSVRIEDAVQAERAAGVNAGRLCIVLIGALAFLSGGGGLAYYCFVTNHSRPAISRPDFNGDSADEQALSAPPAIVAIKKEPGAISLAEQSAIDKAIANGVWYLKDNVLASGTWADTLAPYDPHEGGLTVGFAALPALTLLECGVPANDPIVQKAANLVRQQAPRPAVNSPRPWSGRDTYQVSLAILFLDRLGEKKDVELIQYLALCLIAGMHPEEGGWSYHCPRLDRKRTPQFLKQLRDKKQSLESWRKTALKGVSYTTVPAWDNSNSQFAVLALWVAQRHRVPIDRNIALVRKRFLATQERDGVWTYSAGARPGVWPSMTCSGLLGLSVAHGLTGKGDPQEDQAIRHGLAVLGREIDRPEDQRAMDLYFLWSLMRVGLLYNVPKIDGKDWYAWGRKTVLAKQQPDGSWQNGGYAGSVFLSDTCFALLFLKQANLIKDLTDKLRLLGISVTVAPPAAQTPAKRD